MYKRQLPIIAIPSTAGTGSELSKAAILTDTRRNMKTVSYTHLVVILNSQSNFWSSR